MEVEGSSPWAGWPVGPGWASSVGLGDEAVAVLPGLGEAGATGARGWLGAGAFLPSGGPVRSRGHCTEVSAALPCRRPCSPQPGRSEGSPAHLLPAGAAVTVRGRRQCGGAAVAVREAGPVGGLWHWRGPALPHLGQRQGSAWVWLFARPPGDSS